MYPRPNPYPAACSSRDYFQGWAGTVKTPANPALTPLSSKEMHQTDYKSPNDLVRKPDARDGQVRIDERGTGSAAMGAGLIKAPSEPQPSKRSPSPGGR